MLIFVFLTSMFLVVGIQFTQNSIRQGRNSKSESQVYNVALAGINHAVYWLQKQDTQPVTVFDPKANTDEPDEDPETPVTEENLGLVNEFVIDASRNLWGRYEIGRSPNAEIRDDLDHEGTYSDLYADVYASGAVPWIAEDLSKVRGKSSDGLIWRVRCCGYIFTRTSNTALFDPEGNSGVRVLSKIILEAEIKRNAFDFPKACLYSFASGGGDQVIFDESGWWADNTQLVLNDSTARHVWTRVGVSQIKDYDKVAFKPDPPGVQYQIGCTDPMDTANFVSDNLNSQLHNIFGVDSVEGIKQLATEQYTDLATLPPGFGSLTFVYINPNGNHGEVAFDNSHPLSGGGVLFVDGSLKIAADSEQTWDGVIFVTKKYKQEKFSTITGSVIVGGKIDKIKGEDDKPAKIIYDPATLDRVKSYMGAYQLDRSTLKMIEKDVPPTRF